MKLRTPVVWLEGVGVVSAKHSAPGFLYGVKDNSSYKTMPGCLYSLALGWDPISGIWFAELVQEKGERETHSATPSQVSVTHLRPYKSHYHLRNKTRYFASVSFDSFDSYQVLCCHDQFCFGNKLGFYSIVFV